MKPTAGSTPPAFQPGVTPPDRAWSARRNVPLGRCFAFLGGELLIRGSLSVPEAPGIPTWEELHLWSFEVVRYQYLGILGDEPCWSVELGANTALPEQTSLAGLRALHERVSEAEYALAGRAAQIIAWERDHQFCGRCGAPTDPMPGERARRCPHCELTAYPRVTPAIITLIERDDRILLARGHAFLPGRYGIVAGFVEPGESLEDAVRREAREEVGLELANVAYFASQPWPFPHGIMIGFRADHASGDITIEETEIAHADWFGLDDLPPIPARLSIARRLIDDWAERHGAVIDQP